MKIIYLVSQIFQIIALLLDLIAYHFSTKKKIFFISSVGCIFTILHFLLLGAYSGVAAKTITLFRNAFIAKKEDNKKYDNKMFIIIFVVIYIIFGAITYTSLYSIIPTIIALLYFALVWNGRELRVKGASFLCSILWIIYNIFIMSYAGILANTILFISTGIALYNEIRKQNKKELK